MSLPSGVECVHEKKNVGRQSFTEILSGVDLGSFDKELTDRLNISRGKQHPTFRAPRS